MLMERIELRDRVYERSMEKEYIASLAEAYDLYFASYYSAPVLTIDTDHLDIVHDRPVLDQVAGQIRASLRSILVQDKLL